MSVIEKFCRIRPYPTVEIEADEKGNEIWMYMHADIRPGIRPCFRTELMVDMHAYLASVASPTPPTGNGELRHLVIASSAPAFNLGGDLDLFGKLIRSGNRDELLAYAQSCVEGVYQFHTGLGGDFRTIALVQGGVGLPGLQFAFAAQQCAQRGVAVAAGLRPHLYPAPGAGQHRNAALRLGQHEQEVVVFEFADEVVEGGHQVGLYRTQHQAGVVADGVDPLQQRFGQCRSDACATGRLGRQQDAPGFLFLLQ